MVPTSSSDCDPEQKVYVPEMRKEVCIRNQEVLDDYQCRYAKSTNACYCCGSKNTYIELGTVCTKFCRIKADDKCEELEVGKQEIIELPFNWDSGPDKVEMEEIHCPNP